MVPSIIRDMYKIFVFMEQYKYSDLEKIGLGILLVPNVGPRVVAVSRTFCRNGVDTASLSDVCAGNSSFVLVCFGILFDLVDLLGSDMARFELASIIPCSTSEPE